MLNIGITIYHLILIIIILGNYIEQLPWKVKCAVIPKSQYRMDFCQEKIQVGKFFIDNGLIFFTDNDIQYYVYFRIFNTTNGQLSRQFEMPNFFEKDNSIKIIWAFAFDPLLNNDDDCLNLSLTNFENDSKINEFIFLDKLSINDYCQRLRKLSGIIVVRLSNQQLYFMKYSNGNFIQQEDKMNHFIEFKALVKHLNMLGSVKSVTFDENKKLYITTHYDRYNQICITKIKHGNGNYNLY